MSAPSRAVGEQPTLYRRWRGWQWRSPLLLLAPTLGLMIYTFVLPLATFLQYSFYRFEQGKLIEDFTLKTYVSFLTDDFYHIVIIDSLKVASYVTVLSILVGYPLAYALWRLDRPGLQKWLGLLIFSPVLVSVVVRSYGWTVLLADQGPVNVLLTSLGIIGKPLELLFNMTSVLVSLTHVFLPFVVFPIFATMTRLDPTLREAAADLGAGWWTTFWRITLPLTLPGVVAGAQIAFTLALGAFVTPAILGGGRVLVLPLQIYNATTDINWPVAAVGGVLLLVVSLAVVWASNRLLKLSEST